MALKNHDFQPIIDEGRYSQAVNYIIKEASKLALNVLGKNLTIDTVTIFSQTPEEYKFFAKHLRDIGEVSHFSHGPTLYVATHAGDENSIKLRGVRQPDDSRTEVGYADYPISNYDQIKDQSIKNASVKEIISGTGIPLLELKHPDFDVRGYVVAKKEHDK
jgi:hypothetical protein